MVFNVFQTAQIFNFLEKNRSWNEAFQGCEYRRGLLHCESPIQRLVHLLHVTAHTQSQPSLTKLGEFWRSMNAFRPDGCPTVLELTRYLEARRGLLPKGVGRWDRLFHALREQYGWGDKTSALFLKAAIKIHRGHDSLHFFSDVETALEPIAKDQVYLPVDSVITYIFKQIGFKSPNFHSINKLLHQHYSAEQMLVWDDLWYWGFFTQFVRDGTRVLEWNSDKFWSQLAAPKAREAEVQLLAQEFIAMVRSN